MGSVWTGILTPETMIGPFYVNKMPIRKDNREYELGVELVLDIQFVDVSSPSPQYPYTIQ